MTEKLNLLPGIDLKNVENFEESFFNLMIEIDKLNTFAHMDFWSAIETSRDVKLLDEIQGEVYLNDMFTKYIERISNT